MKKFKDPRRPNESGAFVDGAFLRPAGIKLILSKLIKSSDFNIAVCDNYTEFLNALTKIKASKENIKISLLVRTQAAGDTSDISHISHVHIMKKDNTINIFFPMP